MSLKFVSEYMREWGFILNVFIYLFMKDTAREREREREKQAPCKEPDVGLNPGSRDQAAEPPGRPRSGCFRKYSTD